jgi:hypothetical protein
MTEQEMKQANRTLSKFVDLLTQCRDEIDENGEESEEIFKRRVEMLKAIDKDYVLIKIYAVMCEINALTCAAPPPIDRGMLYDLLKKQTIPSAGEVQTNNNTFLKSMGICPLS